MSVSTEISRLQAARNKIRNKMVAFGLSVSTDNLTALAADLDGVVNQGAVSSSVQEGQTYTIPAGYHNGSGTVTGVAGGGSYTLETGREVTPTTAQQSVTPSSGFYGLSAVTVKAIPSNYKDVSNTTAAAGDVLATKVFTTAAGVETTGTMVNNGAVAATLNTTTTSYTVPAGYHNGSGTVSITTEIKAATPTTSSQSITPTAGRVLSSVTVNAIPAIYGDATDADAAEAYILEGKKAVINDNDAATLVTGTMTNNGAVTATLNTTTTSYTVPAGYHNGSGTVSITTETKAATPTGSAQTITPTSGKVLASVTVNAIPAIYGDATSADAVAANILAGKKAVLNVDGEAVLTTGSMSNNGAVAGTIDGMTATSYTIPVGYHNGSGTVTLTNSVETALAAI